MSDVSPCRRLARRHPIKLVMLGLTAIATVAVVIPLWGWFEAAN